MESNSDKQLRDKLTGNEFPFDPQAWEQMETMLDEKKKRRGIFWWWFSGGIAAGIIITLGLGYGLLLMSDEDKYAENTGSAIQHQVSPESKSPGRQNLIYPHVDDAALAVENNSLGAHQTTMEHENEQTALTHKKESLAKEHNNTNTYSITQSLSAAGGQSSSFNGKINQEKSNREKQREERKNELLKKHERGATNTTVVTVDGDKAADETMTSNAFADYAIFGASVSNSTQQSSNTIAELLQMDKRFAFLQVKEDELVFADDKTDDVLPKPKKKIFNYSLGAVGNISAVTLGLQAGNTQEKWHRKPSFAAGFTHDFLFLNRIAITNSVLYAQTGFKIQSPNAPADTQAVTKNYSSAISELQIPIGIKGYPVAKKHFRFYLAAGIINHINLQEVFTVQKEVFQPNITLTPPVTNLEGSFTSTQDNPFSGVENKSANVMDDSYMKGEQAEYFGLGGLKRYYASFYASAGIEFIAKKHFVFFAEPMFAMTLKKIGLQDSRKYNVGATAGLRYQF